MSQQDDRGVAAGAAKDTTLTMLYTRCELCLGGRTIHDPATGAFVRHCICCRSSSPGWSPSGVTIGQLDGLVKLDRLRQEAGISAAMLRDGRAAAFRDLLAACQKCLAAYDAANATGKANWSGSDVDAMRVAVKKATGGE